MNKKAIILIVVIILIGLGVFTFLKISNNFSENNLPNNKPIADTDGEKIALKVFFNNSELDPEISCNKVFGVERKVSPTRAVAQAALEELLKGPTEEEADESYFTSINPGTKINSITIEDGTAKADFNETLEYQVGGSCRVSAIRAQIDQTLMQFPSVNKVIISINGRTEEILQP